MKVSDPAQAMSSQRDVERRFASPPVSDGRPACWICLGDGPDETGQPLLRHCCSCRGSLGCLHLSCAIKLASTRSKAAVEREDGGDFYSPWIKCPNCRQRYINDLAVGLADELVSVVKFEYPASKMLHLDALYLKLCAVMHHHRFDTSKAWRTACEILWMIRRTETTMAPANPLMRDVRQIEARAWDSLGLMAYEEGTREGAALAVGYFERTRDISRAIGDDVFAVRAELHVAHAKSTRDGGGGVAVGEELEKLGAIYENYVAEYGEALPSTIRAGAALAMARERAGQIHEAGALLKKLIDVARRVHGADHDLTKWIKSQQSPQLTH